jgi:DNA-binding beta-propeller fold protein YncE
MAKAAALTLLLATAAYAQQPPSPTNDAPNPYETVAGWAKLPEGRTWGSTSGVAIDKDGASVWVAERCGANTCVGSSLPPILKFDASGKLVRAFGEGLIQVPHGLHVDRDGNIWVTDWANGRPPARDTTKGHQVIKFSPEGKVLLTLGKSGGAREPDYFWQPNAVTTAPNGDIYVAEGHADAETANARILKFDKTGKFLRSFGSRGDGEGQFIQPHALAFDSRGRLFVGDRSNNRIVIYDQDFTQLAVWTQFSRPSGIYIDKNDVFYVADSESGSVNPAHKDWQRGIRIGSAKDGTVTAFIPDPDPAPRSTSAAEGVAVDAKGIIYGAEVGPKALKRYARKP